MYVLLNVLIYIVVFQLRDYESGRAEAIGALCTIFFNMPCGEQVTRVYLTRFYHSMFIGLKYDPQVHNYNNKSYRNYWYLIV